MGFDRNIRNWTYGAEHELADWDRSRPLPEGFKVDDRDVTIVNSNGIAADPKGRTYGFGGEVNTPPTDTIAGQCKALDQLVAHFGGRVSVNYRSNLHCHVRVPGLSGDLRALKKLAEFNARWLPELLPLIEPIPVPTSEQYPDDDRLKGALKRYNRRKRSHQTIIPASRTHAQLKAKTLTEFFEAEVPWSKKLGKPQWQCQPRAAVNVRQLLETDTIEFRHFPGTLDPDELDTALWWCQDYLDLALFRGGSPVEWFHEMYADRLWPKFRPYVHWMEQRYNRTAHGHGLKRAEIEANTKAILEEDK